MSDTITPFTIAVPDTVLDDLQSRLALARFPSAPTLPDDKEWSYGTPVPRMRALVEHWRHTFDWRAIEADINARLPQFTTPIDAGVPHGILRVHFVHKRSQHASAVPLLFVHGWPGSFLEVSKIIEPLTNPKDPKDPVFHVVAPSIPGYTFSEGSSAPGFGTKLTAQVFDTLMQRLGYTHYIAQGGDWGAVVVKALGIYHPTCRAIHTNMPLVPPPTFLRNPIRITRTVLGFMGLPGGYSAREIDYLKDIQRFQTSENAYMLLQSTKPQTLAFGLTDSPIALLAWIYEKLHTWTDAYPWTNDEILTWVMLYWLAVAGPAGSVRFYKEADFREKETVSIVSARCAVPVGVSMFKLELMKFPDDWLSMVHRIVFRKTHDEGGHFATYEKPELMTEDIRRFAEVVVRGDNALLPG